MVSSFFPAHGWASDGLPDSTIIELDNDVPSELADILGQEHMKGKPKTE